MIPFNYYSELDDLLGQVIFIVPRVHYGLLIVIYKMLMYPLSAFFKSFIVKMWFNK